jgi:hypothetical protein
MGLGGAEGKSMSKCKYCDKEIMWVKTFSGRPMPCDPKPIYFYRRFGGKKRFVVLSGELLAGVLAEETYAAPGEREEIGHIAHFATCSNYGRATPLLTDDARRQMKLF